eukprot:3626788-Rhodomonas_salina.2
MALRSMVLAACDHEAVVWDIFRVLKPGTPLRHSPVPHIGTPLRHGPVPHIGTPLCHSPVPHIGILLRYLITAYHDMGHLPRLEARYPPTP